MIFGVCKGLHCACCKSFGIAPLLVLATIYVISAQYHGVIVSLLLHTLMWTVGILTVSSIITGLVFALFVRLTRRMVRTEHSGREVRNAYASDRQRVILASKPSALVNHRIYPVLYRAPDERKEAGQRYISERRD